MAHVAPAVEQADLAAVIAFADERPRLLFALTAGIGLGLMTGGTQATADPASRSALRRRIAIRGILLILLGLAVIAYLRPLVFVILDVYGVAFLVMLPLLFLPARTALGAGIAGVVIAPIVVEAARRPPVAMGSDGALGLIPEWFLIGAYPVVVWVPVMLIGVGLARAGIHRPEVIARAAAASALVAVFALTSAAVLARSEGTVPRDAPVGGNVVLAASLQTAGNTAVAVLLVAATMTLTAFAVPRVRRVAGVALSPITAMGSMPLTIYTGHLVVIANAKTVRPDGVVTDDSWPLLVGLIIGSAVFAWTWRRFLGRGPLERVFGWASGWGRSGAGRRS
ncbi:hypothetical protein GCM10025870_09610 [Agromyces marinus]|uniref:DUF418 domain-containing protein n=1 Tax=Agromyces marinus TaxID=1389020 RepID=A0ABM8GZH1_9MICO|nr:hypothetical protein [Agromyces marinus]BDZ53888.1 hypothetical protein GCM10025870_09610 [Agromyces marinus]